MASPIRNKIQLWASRRRGVKSSFLGDTKEPALQRDDIPDVLVTNRIKRGGKLQELRLRFYPTVDIELQKFYAGEMRGASKEDAVNRLIDLGYRNNPTAYVEVTDEHGPDQGSYSRQLITEDGGKLDIPRVTQQPSLWKRVKLQNHVVLYDLDDRILFLAHKEVSAWLQPARHVVTGDVSARIGVRDFRNLWFDEFGEELGGKTNIRWNTVR